MTRKDYVKIAEALRLAIGLDDAIERIAVVMKEDNPRFDRDRFLRAVGIIWDSPRGKKL